MYISRSGEPGNEASMNHHNASSAKINCNMFADSNANGCSRLFKLDSELQDECWDKWDLYF